MPGGSIVRYGSFHPEFRIFLEEELMAHLVLILFLVFGLVCALGITGTALCFRRALAVANAKDGDVKMFFWAFGAMICLIMAGMSAAYFLLPILFHF